MRDSTRAAAGAASADAPDDLVAARVARLLAPPVMVQVGDLRIDRVARVAPRAGRPLRLLPREFALLDYLVRHAGQTVPRTELYAAVFGLDFDPGTNRLAVQVSRLRAELDRGCTFSMLVTDRASGYRLVAEPERSRQQGNEGGA